MKYGKGGRKRGGGLPLCLSGGSGCDHVVGIYGRNFTWGR